MNFCTIDIESDNWRDFKILGYYDGELYETFDSIQDFMDYYMYDLDAPTTCYAHFGGIFDFLFIIDFLFTQNCYEMLPSNLIVQGKKILKFTIKYYDRSVEFIDSSGLFPFSLLKLTESFDVEHKKLDGTVDHSKKFVKNKTNLKYLEHDVKGLYESIFKFSQMPYIKGSKLCLTRSGQSFKVFKNHFKPNLPFIPTQIKKFARHAYLGGRTEIFKPLHINKKEKLNVYDINSLYPSVMHDFEYPGEFIGWTTELDLDNFSIIHCVVTAPNDLEIPILGIKHDGKFIFPLGTFEGYFTNIELSYAVKRGYVVDIHHRSALFDNNGFMFRDFIAHFYNARKNTDCPVQKILFKDIMNHLYGRLAINEDRENVTFKPSKTGNSKIHSRIDFGDYEIRLYSEEKHIYTYSNPVLSCFVTSYARLRLYQYFEKVDFNVHYCDTDSIFTTSKLENNFELGKMKLEYQLKEACFLLPKSYGGIKNNGDFLLKLKGFRGGKDNINFNHISFQDLVQTLSGEIRLPSVEVKGGLAGLKRGLKAGDILTVLPDSTKQLKAVYDKRTIFKKGKEYLTKPLKLEYQMRLL